MSIHITSCTIGDKCYSGCLNVNNLVIEVYHDGKFTGFCVDANSVITMNGDVIGLLSPPNSNESNTVKLVIGDQRIDTAMDCSEINCYLKANMFAFKYMVENKLINL